MTLVLYSILSILGITVKFFGILSKLDLRTPFLQGYCPMTKIFNLCQSK